MSWPPQGGWYRDGEPVDGPLDVEDPYDADLDEDYDDDRNEWWLRNNKAAGKTAGHELVPQVDKWDDAKGGPYKAHCGICPWVGPESENDDKAFETLEDHVYAEHGTEAGFPMAETKTAGSGEDGTNFNDLGAAYDAENHPGSGSSSPGGSGAHGNVYDVSDYPTYERTYHMDETDPAQAANPFNSSKTAVVDSSSGVVLAVCADRAAALRVRAALVGGSPFLGATIQLVPVEENPGR